MRAARKHGDVTRGLSDGKSGGGGQITGLEFWVSGFRFRDSGCGLLVQVGGRGGSTAERWSGADGKAPVKALRGSGIDFRGVGFGVQGLGFGLRILGFQARGSVFGFRVSVFRGSGLGFWMSGFPGSESWVRVSGFVVRVPDFEFLGSGLGVLGSDFGFWSSG